MEAPFFHRRAVKMAAPRKKRFPDSACFHDSAFRGGFASPLLPAPIDREEKTSVIKRKQGKRSLFVMELQAVNTRNQFRGTVKEIILGPVVSEVEVETPFGVVAAVITTRSVQELDLKVGSDVLALVKSTAVIIARL
jgi:molybdopterin-binding protein